MSRSANSYMRLPRRVTLTPMGMPSRILNPAMDLRARVVMGFWPDMAVRSRVAASIARAFVSASPSPMLRVILASCGTCIGLV